MNKKYILEEELNISFEAIGYYGKGKNGRRDSFFNFKAHILYTQDELILYAILSEHDDVAKKKLYEALHTSIERKDFRITKAYICDISNEINIIAPNEIRFTRLDYMNGQEVLAMYLKQIRFSYKDESIENIYKLSAVCSSTLKGPTKYLLEEESILSWLQNSTLDRLCFNIPFTLVKYNNHSYLKTVDVEKLLQIFSFYHSTRFEYDMAILSSQNGTVSMVIKSPQYRVTSGNSLKTIGYLLSGQKSMGTFDSFLSISKDCDNMLWSDEFLSSYIGNYVRADYLDDISKLIIYTTILEKMADVGINDNTYRCIKNYLAKNKINIKKIDDLICDYKFKNELRNEKGDIISNFVQLRNCFVHHLGSKEAEKFLRNSLMLFYLKLTITILILYRFGITEIKFKPYFHHLSVFNDCLTERNLEKVKAKKV